MTQRTSQLSPEPKICPSELENEPSRSGLERKIEDVMHDASKPRCQVFLLVNGFILLIIVHKSVENSGKFPRILISTIVTASSTSPKDVLFVTMRFTVSFWKEKERTGVEQSGL